ncbi:MAG: sigma-70 family RNA polymerase sigma factor [Acidobacteria bacterium]|nr:sigma-70 family RNA polymerase sigma factor [Acidobacteriota bacterium]MBI3663897.1 sigma-70 family RNA polymerase sigma factor [Acidobacteriota bacterium]
MTTDEQLLENFQRGSRDAFAELFRRYRDKMYGFFCRRTANPARAEELAQETFLAALKAAPRFEPRALVRTWLFGIAMNLLMADRRKNVRQAPEASGQPVQSKAEEARTVDCDPAAALWVRDALAQLDDDHREILLLREYEQLSYAEIAALLELPVNTVRSRLFRARMALKDLLVPHGAPRGTNAAVM